VPTGEDPHSAPHPQRRGRSETTLASNQLLPELSDFDLTAPRLRGTTRSEVAKGVP
jgi:hypothetical protein